MIYFLGEFYNAFLKKTDKWTPATSLAQVIKHVTDHIDRPDIDYPSSFG